MLYFDHAATTPMSSEALSTYETVAKNFYANSESLHQAGNVAGQLIQEAKVQLAQALNLISDGLIFTSGGTQSNQLGIDALAHGTSKKEILVSPMEHASVYQILDKLSDRGFHVKTLPVNSKGQVSSDTLTQAISPETGLIVIQAVNSITGICQNISELNKIALTHDCPLFVDAVQGLGKIPLKLAQVAGFSASGHKLNGPKGCGLLYLNPNYLAHPFFQHVFQQNGFLPGTLDTPAIVSMTTAILDNLTHLSQNYIQLQFLKTQFLHGLQPSIQPVATFASFPGICGVLLPHTPGQEAVTALGQLGICCSTVSACSLKDPRPDNTLSALGFSIDAMERYLRFSFGSENTIAEIQTLTSTLNKLYQANK